VVVQKAAAAGLVRVINEVGLEDYLKGVVPSEMPSDWPLEALRAQAVAARTYALWRSEIAGGGQGGWLAATVSDQVYGGRDVERAATNEAVESTGGQALFFEGSPLPAYFHSTCGGITEQPARVWKRLAARMGPVWHEANERVFAAAVCSECAASPFSGTWRHFLSWTNLAAKLRRQTGLRSIDAIRVDARHPSGRVSWFVAHGRDARGRDREVRVDGQELRMSLGPSRVRSLLCEVEASRAPAGTLGGVVFQGRGWGHGAGLCQWGARGMAERGFGFRQILHRYYPGAGIGDESGEPPLAGSGP
jgi:stage II sporulation protein D